MAAKKKAKVSTDKAGPFGAKAEADPAQPTLPIAEPDATAEDDEELSGMHPVECIIEDDGNGDDSGSFGGYDGADDEDEDNSGMDV